MTLSQLTGFAAIAAVFASAASGLALESDTSTAAKVDFNRDVRPILAQFCFQCHGSDSAARQSGLRLDQEQATRQPAESGEWAIVPGKPDQSQVIRRIFSSDEDEVMPPRHTKATMPESAKEVIRTWIADGATYQPHWAYLAPKMTEIPVASQPIHPIDYFVRQRLSVEGLVPNPQADPYTLVRRVYLDLIGLPPTPQEADDYVNDPAPDKYLRLVDSLLDSKHYGERWARRWLDLARYADTNGFEKDRPRTIWPYRDWVVKALNDDLPYDQFGIKQLAGDMLPGATPEDLIATGFHRNTMLNEEGGIDPLEYRFHAMVDRVAVTSTVWLGLTMNCAQCHTHKYDPIQHADFYRLMGLLNNADEPTYTIPSPELDRQYQAHAQQMLQMEAELPSNFPGGPDALESSFQRWMEEQSKSSSAWQVLSPTRIKTNMPHLELQHDGFLLGSGDVTKSDVYDLHFEAPIRGVRALRIEVASHPSLPNEGPGMTSYEGPIGGFFLSELQASQQSKPISIGSAAATNDEEEDRINDAAATKAKAKAARQKKKNNAIAALDAEMSSGWQVLGGPGVQHAAVFVFASPIDLHAGLDLRMLFEKHFACSLGHFRISVTTDSHATATGHPADIEQMLANPSNPLSGSDRTRLKKYFLEVSPEMDQAAKPLRDARSKPPRGQTTLVMRERPANNPRSTHRHHRGEYLQPVEEVMPGVPSFLPPLPEGEPANRLTLARWLFAPNHPLTARVAVNRQWQAFFGQGLVKSLEDFGYQSEAPSHPELLDWLAHRLLQDGWSMKKLHRWIVTSQTYQQSSRVTNLQAQRDPENRWLSRSSRFRLDAELIRDAALKAAGVLSKKMGGPGVYPPQPASVTTEGTYGSIEWKTSEGEDRYRRSLYTFMKRTAPFAMSLTFDGPSGESCLARREVSNSPLQALTLLNDQMFVEVAQALARQVLAESPSDAEAQPDKGSYVDKQRLRNMFRRCVTRPPSEEELDMMQQLLGQSSLPMDQEQRWTIVGRAMLNLDEAITHP